MDIQSAPLQGYTDHVWRNAHEKLFGGVSSYYTPFMRIEHGEIRKKDLRDVLAENNSVSRLVPQILAMGNEHVCRMLDILGEEGYKEVDVNLGCPFPPVVKRKQGSGMLGDAGALESLLATLSGYGSDMKFSFKMRLGISSVDEGVKSIAMIDSVSPVQIAVHARLGVQQYKGDADADAFGVMIEGVKSPLVYNGDLCSVDDIKEIEKRFPRLKAVMIGRGLLRNPALAREYVGEEPLAVSQWLQLHDIVFYHFSDYLQGDAHILAKMKPFWEYAPEQIERKILKLVKKSTSVDKYRAAVDMLASSI